LRSRRTMSATSRAPHSAKNSPAPKRLGTPTVQLVTHLFFVGVNSSESFVHHEETETIAEVEQFGRGRVVAGANSVHPDLLERAQAAFPDAGGDAEPTEPPSW